MAKPLNLSIILPVKDEPYLFQLLWQLKAFVKVPYEVKIQTEKGLGYAVKCGIEKSKGDIIVVCDADGSHPVNAIPKMINLLKANVSIVIGSRYVKDGATKDSFSREVISRIYCKFAQLLFHLKIKDSMSGFIVAKKEVFTTLPLSNHGFKFVMETLVKSRGRFKAVEYPITFKKRKLGHSKASPKEAVHTLIFMLKLFGEKNRFATKNNQV